jgi:hypothetical protein
MMDDQYHNVGGSYIEDPETGERMLLSRTYDPANPVAGVTAPAAPTEQPVTEGM